MAHLLAMRRPSAGAALRGGGAATPFPVPSYLKHSAFHYLLYTYSLESSTQLQEGGESKGKEGGEEKRDVLSNAWQNTFVGGKEGRKGGGGGLDGGWKLNLDGDGRIGLPTGWDEKDRSELVAVGGEGRRVDFVGELDAAAVRANRAVPREAGIFYWEVEILNKGRSGYIGIGFSTVNVNLARLPGWERESYGYHGDDGFIFEASGNGTAFGPKFTTGDTIGVGLDWTWGAGEDKDGARAFFTKNGRWINYAFEGVKGAFYPSVGMRTPGESVRVNFGQDGFKFDIESYVLTRKEAIRRSIETTLPRPSLVQFSTHSLAPSSTSPSRTLISEATPSDPHPFKEEQKLTDAIEDLVQSYLSHEGYWQSAKALKEERDEDAALLLGPETRSEQRAQLDPSDFPWASPERVKELQTVENLASALRVHVKELLVGEAEDPLDEVIGVCESSFKGIFDADPGRIWLFKARVRKFAEMILGMGMEDEDMEEGDEEGEGDEWSDANDGMTNGYTNGSTVPNTERVVEDAINGSSGELDGEDEEREMEVDEIDLNRTPASATAPLGSQGGPGAMNPPFGSSFTLPVDFGASSDGMDHQMEGTSSTAAAPAEVYKPFVLEEHGSTLSSSNHLNDDDSSSDPRIATGFPRSPQPLDDSGHLLLSPRARSKMRARSPFPTLPKYSFDEVMKYGKHLRSIYKSEEDPVYSHLLTKASSLLAFEEKIKSVLRGEGKLDKLGFEEELEWMIAPDGREALSTELDLVILSYMGKSQRSDFERLFRHTFTVLHQLGLSGSPATLQI
ncbi:SPRY-domain-containing protein [Atractiella rhizophila]|nr:SPRY-domain-containing protein [Atractiella rhizophila]